MKDDGIRPPLDMTYQDRMERLYNFLVQMGHVVYPIYKEGTHNEIECLQVKVALSSEYPAQRSSKTNVLLPMKGSKVISLVTPTQTNSEDIIDIPPKV